MTDKPFKFLTRGITGAVPGVTDRCLCYVEGTGKWHWKNGMVEIKALDSDSVTIRPFEREEPGCEYADHVVLN